MNEYDVCNIMQRMTNAMLVSLGAINKITGEYIHPKIANKTDKYICPDCNKDLILCQGEIRVHHFRHYTDTTNPCNYYNSPNESQIHKDAKMLLKSLFERKTPISFIRKYKCCTEVADGEIIEIPEMTETTTIVLEQRFEYDGLKIADVAYLNNNEIEYIFEICNTHKTCNEDRPEPWFEIDANTLLNMANDPNINTFMIPCIRNKQCFNCEIARNHFTFVCQKISLCIPDFPKTTLMHPPTDEPVTICTPYLIQCEPNFTKDERDVINEYNIYNINDLIRNEKISKDDKQRTLRCYKYVMARYDAMDVEPFNGNNAIKLDKYLFGIRIIPDGNIKFYKSLGEKNRSEFTTIQWGS